MTTNQVNGNELNEAVQSDDNAPITMGQLKSILNNVEENMNMLAEGLEEANEDAIETKEWYNSLDRKEQLEYEINKFEEKWEKRRKRAIKSIKRKYEVELKTLERTMEQERREAIGDLDDERDAILAKEAEADMAVLDRKTRKLGRVAGNTVGKVTRPAFRSLKSIWANLK